MLEILKKSIKYAKLLNSQTNLLQRDLAPYIYILCYYSRGVWVIFRPYPNEFVQVMGTQNRRVPGQVIKVVHDDCHEQVQHLQCT